MVLSRDKRLESISEYVLQHKLASIEELCREFEISVMTAHRDLNDLTKSGRIVKVRGGARAVQKKTEELFTQRELEHNAEKVIVAKKIIEHIKPNTSIFIDAGTTTLTVAKQMPDLEVNIFTVAPSISLELTNVRRPVITECAGTLDRENLMLTGYFTLSMLDQINIDMALIATSGFSLETGFTCGVESQMMVKRRAIERAKTVYVLMDNTKLDKIFPFTFASLRDIDYIVTDQGLPADYADALKANNVVLI